MKSVAAAHLIPSAEYIKSVKVGDLALNCFGSLAEVVEVSAVSQDIEGKWFVCYATRSPAGGSFSMSMKEGKLVRTVGLTAGYTANELRVLERDLQS